MSNLFSHVNKKFIQQLQITSFTESPLYLRRTQGTRGLSRGIPSSIVFLRALKVSLGSLSLITASLKTILPKISDILLIVFYPQPFNSLIYCRLLSFSYLIRFFCKNQWSRVEEIRERKMDSKKINIWEVFCDLYKWEYKFVRLWLCSEKFFKKKVFLCIFALKI